MAISNSFQGTCLAVLLGGVVLLQQGGEVDKRKCAEPQAVADTTYRPGQVWSYKTRPGEGSSTITVLRVESLPTLGVIVHIRIDGFQFKNCSGGPAPTTVQHAPFSKAAIDKSVTRLLRSFSELPAYQAGYEDWLAHCGGVYTISIAEMIDADDATFNTANGCKG
jgi:hypothetical protein